MKEKENEVFFWKFEIKVNKIENKLNNVISIIEEIIDKNPIKNMENQLSTWNWFSHSVKMSISKLCSLNQIYKTRLKCVRSQRSAVHCWHEILVCGDITSLCRCNTQIFIAQLWQVNQKWLKYFSTVLFIVSSKFMEMKLCRQRWKNQRKKKIICFSR